MDRNYEQDLEYSDCEGDRYYIMYHGTTMEAAQNIKRYGFKRSSGGMLGPGVYVSRSVKKARSYPKNPDKGERLAILKLKVRVGKVKRINRQGHPLQYTWHEHGYDTAWVPPNCGMVGSGLEEDCVWDPDRIKVLEIFEHFKDHSDDDSMMTTTELKMMRTLLMKTLTLLTTAITLLTTSDKNDSTDDDDD